MVKIYYRLIRDKALTIEQVPALWRAATQALLDADKPVDTPTPENAASDTPGPEEGAGGVTDILEGMTVVQLREYAANHGIDLGGATKKADILAAIRAVEATKEET